MQKLTNYKIALKHDNIQYKLQFNNEQSAIHYFYDAKNILTYFIVFGTLQ